MVISNKPSVLVVDDEETSQIYFSRQLQQYNLNVVAANHGKQAIAEMGQQPFDLILLDIIMPEMNGFQVLEAIKANPNLSHIPVVVVSGLDDLDSLIRCIELGAEDYLFKPLNPVLLKARIGACLERKRLRDQEQAYLNQLQAEKAIAESANREKSAFLANISHELRTPLNAIISYSEILREEVQEVASPLVPDLEKIRTSAKHLLGLVNDLLDLSKIEAGKMELYLETFDIVMLVEELTSTIQPQVEMGRNTFEVSYAGNLGVMHADHGKVRQVLLNLLHNASKFTEQGMIRLTVERQDSPPPVEHSGSSSELSSNLAALQTTPLIRFTISDTGIGIHPRQQELLFAAFNRGMDFHPYKPGGTGMGLALCQRLCRMMGGEIQVESTPGEGTTFTVDIPVDMIDQRADRILAEADPFSPIPSYLSASSELVLVIDSDRSIRDQMVEALNQNGLRAVTAWCGREGLRLARELCPNWIVLDVLMPAMDSWMVLNALKADPVLADVPVITVAIAPNQNLSFTIGVSECLTNPTDFNRLARSLRSYRPATHGGQILLLQEDSTTNQVIQRILEKEEWRVTTVKSLSTAVEQVEQLQPDLVLVDLLSPDLRSLEVVARLRHHPKLNATPVFTIVTHDFSREDHLWFNGYIKALLQQKGYSYEPFLHQLYQLIAPRSSTDGFSSNDVGFSYSIPSQNAPLPIDHPKTSNPSSSP